MIPVNGDYLLDSSVAVRILRGDEGVRRRFVDADEVIRPAIVVGELLYGAIRSL